jgi:hypothetical protein
MEHDGVARIRKGAAFSFESFSLIFINTPTLGPDYQKT